MALSVYQLMTLLAPLSHLGVRVDSTSFMSMPLAAMFYTNSLVVENGVPLGTVSKTLGETSHLSPAILGAATGLML
jgi:hypothetical protein